MLLFLTFRKERKDRDRSKRSRDDASEDERARYNARANKMPNTQRSGFRHDQQPDRGSHAEHDRWSGNRFGNDHNEYKREHGYEYKREHYEHQRAPGYHRDRDHLRPDKRYLLLCSYCFVSNVYFFTLLQAISCCQR